MGAVSFAVQRIEVLGVKADEEAYAPRYGETAE
jgi:hypothetical protein